MTQSKDPLHGVTLKLILERLVSHYGWKKMSEYVDINCFIYQPTITSSLRFLRKNPWARADVEDLYLHMKREIAEKKRNGEVGER